MLFSSFKSSSDYIEIKSDDRSISCHLSSSSPATPFQRAFSSLKDKMKDCLHSRCASGVHIFSADAGSGKSRAVQSFVREWKETGFPGDGSIIIFLATFDEIDSFRQSCQLDQSDFACVSADRKFNQFGLGRSRSNEAKVLFTTHEQARRRIAEHGGFEAIASFHYLGKPRTLRLWDEGLDAARPVSFNLNILEALPTLLRDVAGSDGLITAIDALRLDKAQRQAGFILSFPIELRDLAHSIAIPCKKAGLPSDILQAVEGLAHLAGQRAILRKERKGLMVVGAGEPIPNDLAPLIIFDASARLRRSYRYWADRCSNVNFLHMAVADYSAMELHWWDRSAGKSSLADPVERQRIVAVAAELINNSDAEWLVIHQKKVESRFNGVSYCVADEIQEKLHTQAKARFIHWGKHIASNEHRDIKNVLIIGGNHYPYQGYEAIYMAATGTLANIDKAAVGMIGAYEFAHHVYQAACRSNLRNMNSEAAGTANVYLIAANRGGRKEALEEAFPNCTMYDWTPVPPKRKKKVQIVMDTMMALFSNGRLVVTTKELWQACGGKNADYLKRIWQDSSLAEFMTDKGIRRRGNKLIIG
ncbi:hypothetical protein EGM87_01025 [Sphingobium sp. RSMS]|uniref:hypothetical protein n=1 Tax=Sphingobium sp. RSMS TaxID=520734 RepID=UPI0010F59145|nr:hypothetical protein [Sphingobium sp. RSMS]UXC91106.1 hypothetical protein EGM87_01025 [Sphingobium sp. RSMS]